MASKLSKTLKVQVVLSLVLFYTDYCNTLLLTYQNIIAPVDKILHAALRLIFQQWFCFAYAYATIFEKLSYFITQVSHSIQNCFAYAQMPP